jgi:hypothetical protein
VPTIERAVRAGLIAGVCASMLAVDHAHASLARNAAGAKNIGNAGALVVDTAGELESETDGKVWLAETDVQYQLGDRFQFLIEGVLFESQQPDAGQRASGFGDTDVTLSWLAVEGTRAVPSVVFGARAKLPTASHEDIGTGKPDFGALLVLGRESGELELSLEAEYTTFGNSGGVERKNQFAYAFTAEYGLNDFLAVYGEVFGNSAPTSLESRTDAARVGLEVDIPVSERVAPYLSFEVDTEGARAGRAGIEWTW